MTNETMISVYLKQLRLSTMRNHYQEIEQQALENHWSYGKYLATLCDAEVTHREQQRLSRYLKESRLPREKTLSTFDFKIAQTIHAAQIEALAENVSWVNKAENVIIFGPSGVGKSHIAIAIGHGLVQEGVRVLFTSTLRLVQQLQEAHKEYRLSAAMDKLSRFDVIILDDFGYVKKDMAETNVLFEFIAERYETGSLIITANQPFSEWDHIFPDTMMTVAAVDRLIHHAVIITIQEESYRRLESEKKRVQMQQALDKKMTADKLK